MDMTNFDYEHEGIVCLKCGTVLVSYYQHHFVRCGCNQSTFVDGGQTSYTRYGSADLKLIRHVRIIPIIKTKSGKISKKKIKTYREVYGK